MVGVAGTVYAEEINADINENVKQFYQDYNQMPKYTPTNQMPKFTEIENITISTKRPTIINFNVKAVDYLGVPINVECDRISGTLFKLGKTTVNCIAVDSFGNTIRKNFKVTVGVDVVEIPSWFKPITGYWMSGQITDADYFSSLNYLLKKEIILIPTGKLVKTNPMTEIPSWVYHSAGQWADKKTGDHEFSIAVEWLIHNGFTS